MYGLIYQPLYSCSLILGILPALLCTPIADSLCFNLNLSQDNSEIKIDLNKGRVYATVALLEANAKLVQLFMTAHGCSIGFFNCVLT